MLDGYTYTWYETMSQFSSAPSPKHFTMDRYEHYQKIMEEVMGGAHQDAPLFFANEGDQQQYIAAYVEAATSDDSMYFEFSNALWNMDDSTDNFWVVHKKWSAEGSKVHDIAVASVETEPLYRIVG